MKRRNSFYAFIVLILVGVGITTAGEGLKPQYGKSEKAFYLPEADLEWIEPGLKLEIRGVEFQPPNVLVTFRISEDRGRGLDRLGIETVGTVSASFQLARIKPGDTQYTSYTGRISTSAIQKITNFQPVGESNGTYANLGDGAYKSTLATKLPADFEVNSTHTLAMYARRDLTEFGLRVFVANAFLDFVPSGAPVTQVRDVVRTEACNQCPDPLAFHGGSYRSTRLCIM